jgi:very-long-chain enoyl-CoA reductase
VSCPHYFFEIVSWIGFAIAIQTIGSLAFLAASAGVLVTWARKRHRAYLAEFDGREGRELYPKDRKALVPFVY